MSDTYTSSVVSKYGDIARVKEDAKTLREIIERQGSSLLIDVVTESAGRLANQWRLEGSERNRIIDSLTAELREALDERL